VAQVSMMSTLPDKAPGLNRGWSSLKPGGVWGRKDPRAGADSSRGLDTFAVEWLNQSGVEGIPHGIGALQKEPLGEK